MKRTINTLIQWFVVTMLSTGYAFATNITETITVGPDPSDPNSLDLIIHVPPNLPINSVDVTTSPTGPVVFGPGKGPTQPAGWTFNGVNVSGAGDSFSWTTPANNYNLSGQNWEFTINLGDGNNVGSGGFNISFDYNTIDSNGNLTESIYPSSDVSIITPEPSTLFLFGLGFAGLGLVRKRVKK